MSEVDKERIPIEEDNEYSLTENSWKTWFNDNYDTLELAGYVGLGTTIFCAAGGFFLYKYYYDESDL